MADWTKPVKHRITKAPVERQIRERTREVEERYKEQQRREKK